MPPKVKVTKEDIINAAVDIVRKSGAQAINARTVASVLNCSTQPVFSNFATMDELRLAVAKKSGYIMPRVYAERGRKRRVPYIQSERYGLYPICKRRKRIV